MGFTPRQVDEMSFWEFLATRDGWLEANCPPDDKSPPTPEEHDAMLEKYGYG
jgi:hypothetical protein